MSARTATEARGEARVQSDRPDVFISYSRKDEEFVRRLVDALEHRGKDVWIDWEDIRKSADWRAKVHAGIEASRTIVPVLSPDFATSDVCREEVEHAVRHNKRLVPIVRREVDGDQEKDSTAWGRTVSHRCR
jgi:TIR domain